MTNDPRHYDPRQRWTDEEKSQFQELAAQGKNDHEIGAIMGKTWRAIGRQRYRHSIYFHKNFNWTEEAVNDLKIWWTNEGLSASKVAKEFNKKYGSVLTRNAILGKLDRLGGNDRPNPDKKSCGTGKHGPRKPRRFILTPHMQSIWSEPPAEVNSTGVSFHLLHLGQCKYIAAVVTSHDIPACGAPVLKGFPYCAAHCRLCYNGHGASSASRAPSGTIASSFRPPDSAGAVVPQ